MYNWKDNDSIYKKFKLMILILSKKGDVKLIFAYIEILLPLFRNVNWFSLCVNFVSCHRGVSK